MSSKFRTREKIYLGQWLLSLGQLKVVFGTVVGHWGKKLILCRRVQFWVVFDSCFLLMTTEFIIQTFLLLHFACNNSERRVLYWKKMKWVILVLSAGSYRSVTMGYCHHIVINSWMIKFYFLLPKINSSFNYYLH